MINLLTVDDSKIMREALAGIIADDSKIKIVGEAANGIEALEAVRQCNPDVITLDVTMPGMDGVTMLKHMMINDPRPTVMLSSLTQEGATVTFDALRYGAVDFIAKPLALNDVDFSAQTAEIHSKIVYAADFDMGAVKYIRGANGAISSSPINRRRQSQKIVALGAAEGGYGALLKIIPQLRSDSSVSYLVTMYAAREYIDAFAGYLNANSTVHVKRAEHEEIIRPGVCYLSSGEDYMSVHKQDDTYALHVSPAPFISRKGAVDMLLFSTADTLGADSVGVILSGSGSDGAEGLEEIIRRGGVAFIQEPKTCLCREMSLSAQARCESGYIVPDSKLAVVMNEL